jgi:nucleoside 2-deoxyribosyltransferase
MIGKCPICKLDCELEPQGVDAEVKCRRCGKFVALSASTDLWTRTFGRVPGFLAAKGADPRDTTKVGQLLAPYLSIYVRDHTERGGGPVGVDIGTASKLEELAETYANTPVSLKAEKLLRLLEKRTSFPGQPVEFSAPIDYPAVHAIRAEEASYYLRALEQAGLIDVPALTVLSRSHDATLEVDATITLSGWERLGYGGSASRMGFVAMSFAPELDGVFSGAIEPAIRAAGYEPVRVDKIHHNEKICDRIIVEIRRARFVVADVTMQRPGVYFEAGFAMALGLPVIWCCRKDDIANVHFDTRQYNHIVWEKPAELHQQLLHRIHATIGALR